MNKKSNILNIIILLFLLLSLIFSSVIGLKILKKFRSSAEDIFSTDELENIDKGGDAFEFMDLILPISLIIFGVIFIFTAFYVKTSPAYMLLSIFLLMIVMIVSSIIGNIIGALDQADSLQNETTSLDLSMNFAEKIPLYTLIVGGLFLLVLYGLWSGWIGV